MALSVRDAEQELQELDHRLAELDRLRMRCSKLERFIELGRSLEGKKKAVRSSAPHGFDKDVIPPITIA